MTVDISGPPSCRTVFDPTESYEKSDSALGIVSVTTDAPLTPIKVEPSGPGSLGNTSNNYPANDGRASGI